LLNFIKRIRIHNQRLSSQGPIAVHCSAGIGRTGTFIAIDYSFQKLQVERSIDIFNLVKEMRKQRPFMVQTLEQYIFCHDAVLEVMLCGNTSVAAPDLRTHVFMLSSKDPDTRKTGFERQLQILKKVSPDKSRFTYTGRRMTTAKKNRYNTCVPTDQSRVLLEGSSTHLTDNTYICATYVDGYRKKQSYITTQGPLNTTVSDFWRMIWENEIGFIAMVTKMKENGEEMSVQYWPSEGTKKYSSVTVTLLDEMTLQDYVIRKFELCHAENKHNKTTVTQFHYFNWSVGQLPGNPHHLLDMMNKLQREQRQTGNKTIVVMCNDGVHRCGIFCAVSIIIETLKTEQVVDIFQIIKALRLHNPDYVTGLVSQTFISYECIKQLFDISLSGGIQILL
jgi:netrin-G3 ligand